MKIKINKLAVDHPCHNQAAERHVKLITEASLRVARFERRDGMILQKIKSRKLMPSLNTKKKFSCESCCRNFIAYKNPGIK